MLINMSRKVSDVCGCGMNLCDFLFSGTQTHACRERFAFSRKQKLKSDVRAKQMHVSDCRGICKFLIGHTLFCILFLSYLKTIVWPSS